MPWNLWWSQSRPWLRYVSWWSFVCLLFNFQSEYDLLRKEQPSSYHSYESYVCQNWSVVIRAGTYGLIKVEGTTVVGLQRIIVATCTLKEKGAVGWHAFGVYVVRWNGDNGSSSSWPRRDHDGQLKLKSSWNI